MCILEVLLKSVKIKGTYFTDADGCSLPGLEEALKRKDAIIRVRNAQISALWDELHTRQPWTNALSGDAPINLATETPVNASRKLLVIGINTVSLPHAAAASNDRTCSYCSVLYVHTCLSLVRSVAHQRKIAHALGWQWRIAWLGFCCKNGVMLQRRPTRRRWWLNVGCDAFRWF